MRVNGAEKMDFIFHFNMKLFHYFIVVSLFSVFTKAFLEFCMHMQKPTALPDTHALTTGERKKNG